MVITSGQLKYVLNIKLKSKKKYAKQFIHFAMLKIFFKYEKWL